MTRSIAEHLSRVPPCLAWAQLPTPVQPFGEAYPQLWVKRDDLSHPRYGGSKVRKLEWLLADPRWSQGPVLSVGAIGSHHLRALAEFLDLQDRRLHALVCPQVATAHARRNLRRLLELDARIVPMSSRVMLPFAWLKYRASRIVPKGQYLAAGGSEGVGLLAFIQAGLELAEQIEAKQAPLPSRIYIAAGTAGSVAGLCVGLGLAGCKTRIVAVSSVERVAFNRLMFTRKKRQCESEFVRWGGKLSGASTIPVEITHAQLGAGYGVPTQPAKQAIDRAHDAGLKLEPTYTGKVFAELLAREQGQGEPVLFWNTHASTPQWSGQGGEDQPWPDSIAAWSKCWPSQSDA